MKSNKYLSYLLICLQLSIWSCNNDEQQDEPIIIKESIPVTDYDGNTYKTVQIGNQIWMAENLKTTHYSDGSPVSSFSYNNDTANISQYGRLYTWDNIMHNETGTNANPSNVQGLAPQGWHIPSNKEWQELINNLGGASLAGGLLKEAGELHWQTPNTDGTNESLFCALPGGMFAFWKQYQWIRQNGVFASTTDISVPEHPAVIAIKLNYNNSTVIIGEFHPDDAVSVRCIKNKE